MSRRSTRYVKAGLSALYYTGIGDLMAPLTRGVGTIFMLHQISAASPGAFEPNRILRVTPDFLDLVIRQVRAVGIDIVPLDEARERLLAGRGQRPFACFTLDDGYRDNLEVAMPVFVRHQAPFTVYVPTDYPDGRGELWWLALEKAVSRLDEIEITAAGVTHRFRCATDKEKEAAFHAAYWGLRGLDEVETRLAVRRLAASAGIDVSAMCRELIMTWAEIRALATNPLVTIGAHTCRHYALAKLPADVARREIADSIARITHELGRPCRHFSYPYGDACSAGEREFALAADLGIATAVTTRKGLVFEGHAQRLGALPRLSLNGDYQDPRHLEVLMSGVPFALLDMASRLRGRIAR